MSDTNIQKADGSAVPAVPENTHAGPVYTPAVDIFETDLAITVLADMPGVEPSDLTIDLRENVLTLVGRVTSPETNRESVVLREHHPGTFCGSSRSPKPSIRPRSTPNLTKVYCASNYPRSKRSSLAK